jgi:hypothetical protein
MDFAFAPGATKYDKIIRKMFTYRTGTTLVNKKGVNTIDDFFNQLTTVVTTPLTYVLIGTHGDEAGYMKIQLDKTTNPTTHKIDANTDFEIMERGMAAVPRVCQLADAVINPRPVDSNNVPIDPYISIRGCRIGVMTPFIQKFKDVVNGLSTTDVAVAAPKFYHEVYQKAQGVFEGFNYDFHIFSPTAIASKADLVAKLDGLTTKYQDIYGTDITTAQWNTWIPKKITKEVDPLVRTKLNPSPIPRFPSLKSGRYKYARRNVVNFTMSTSAGTLPTTQATIVPFLKTLVNNQAANPGTDPFWLMFASTHPFPFFKRHEYDTIDDMIDGLEWILNTKSRVYTGRRYEYYVSPPVVNNNANNELIFNFHAAPGSGTTASITFADDDSNYFNKV